MAYLRPGLLLLALLGAQADRVWIDQTSLPYRVMSSEDGELGREGTIRGAGGLAHQEAARSAGADAIRSWDIETLNTTILEVGEHGLRISVGIWLPHEPKYYEGSDMCGDDLDGDAFWNGKLEFWLQEVRRHKGSTAVLWWTVGNEIEMEVNIAEGSPCLWRRLEWVAQAVKAEDPDHPVGTVTAGVAQGKVEGLLKHAPCLDFLGVNSYGDASLEVSGHLLDWGWTKPYALMEYGPRGHWESPVTFWGSYIEETSSQKVARYNATCFWCQEDPRCIGGFAFVWGWKWEKTGTWYGVFNEWEDVTLNVQANCSDCESEVVPVLEQCWTGLPRQVMPPSISNVSINGSDLPYMAFASDTNETLSLSVQVHNPGSNALTAIWAVTEEIVSSAIGGAFEATNPLLGGRWPLEPGSSTAAGLSTVLSTRDLPVGGKYRLYVFVRPDPASCPSGGCPNHEATANLPFEVCHTVGANETNKTMQTCHSSVLYAKDHIRRTLAHGGLPRDPLFPGIDADSSERDIQAMLHQMGGLGCPMPCGAEAQEHVPVAWCHNAVEGEECYDRVEWARLKGIREAPHLYRGLSEESSAEQFQLHLYLNTAGVCPRPCLSLDVVNVSDGEARADHGGPEETSAGVRSLAAPGACLAMFLAVISLTIT